MTSPGSHNVRIVISADVAQAIRQLGQVSGGLGQVGTGAEQAQRQTSRMGDVMKGALAASGIQVGLSSIVSGIKGVVSSGLGYEQSMNTMRAVTGGTADQMSKVAEEAKRLGSDIKIPGASAQTAAAAMTELAKGGLSVEESMGAARGTMILAAAAQIEGAQAAEIQANALNTFGLKADEAGRVANVLANVANQSSGEITDFSQALAMSGSVAHMMGMSIEDTATALGLFANAGIKGSDAGTTLKSSITQLLNPSKESQKAIDELGLTVWDSMGNFVGYRSIVEQLADAQGRMSQESFTSAAAQVLGTDAVRAGAIVAAGGTAAWDEMAGAIGNVTGAQDVAAANSKGLTGVIDALKNTVDTASLSLFETLQPSIMKVAEAATGLVGPLAEGLAPALGSVADLASGTLAPAIGQLTGVISAVAGPVSGLVGWVSDLPGPIGAAVIALGGVIALRGPLTATFASWTTASGTLLATLRGTAGAAAAGSAGLAGWVASLRAASGAAATFGVVAKGALSIMGGPIGLAIIGVTTALALFSSGTDDASASTEGLSDAIDEQTGKLKGNAAQIIASEAANSGASAAYERIGGKVSDYVDALGGVPGAQEKVNAKLAEAKAAYDAQQDAMQAATTGTGNFGTATATAGPSVFDLSTATDYLSSAQGTLAGKTEAVRLSTDGATGALSDMGDAATDAEGAATPFADALKAVRDASSEGDAAINFLIASMELLVSGSISAETAQRSNEAAIRAVIAATRDQVEANLAVEEATAKVTEKQAEFDNVAAHLGTTLDGQEVSSTNLAVTQADVDKASRELAAAQLAAADAADGVTDASDKQFDSLGKLAENARTMVAEAYNNKVAQGDMQGAVAEATRVTEEQRAKFVETVAQINGGNIPAAEALATEYGLIPKDVKTIVSQEGIPTAITEVQRLRQEIAALTDSPHIVRVAVESGDIVYTTETGRKMQATGGAIYGSGSGTSDSIPAMLSDGEFVSTAATVKRPGNRAALNFMHSGGSFSDTGIPGFKDGGPVVADVPIQFTTGNLVDTGWQEAIDAAAIEKAKKFGFAGSRLQFINAALSKQGSAYVWGAAGPDVFDCSGLVSWALEQAGIGKGRLTAQGFNAGFPHVGMPGKAGDLATFDTGRLPGQAGHIGIITDPARGLMMHTDGAGPARIGDYKSRDGGPLSIVDVVGLTGGTPGGSGDPETGWLAGSGSTSRGSDGKWGTTAGMNTNTRDQWRNDGNMSMVGPVPPGGALDRWRQMYADALALKGQYSDSNLSAMMNQMRSESSGNPLAINKSDRNWQAGYPSKSLLQVIPPTFDANGDPGFNTNIWDPWSNARASINYGVGRYGSISGAYRGVAYGKGGIVPGDPAWGDSMNAWLTPGEAVLRPEQWSTAHNAINQVQAAATQQYGLSPSDITNAMAGMTFQLENGGDSIRMIAKKAALAVTGQQSRMNRINGGR